MALIAHYRLDGDATDAVGNNHGVASGVAWVDGKLGRAGSFDGGGSYIDTGLSKEVYISDISVSLWAMFSDDSRGILVGNYDHTGGIGLEKHTGGRLRVWINFKDYFTPTGVFTLGAWHHIAFVRSVQSGNWTLYVDGSVVGVSSSAGAWSSLGLETLRIGRDIRTGTTTVKGLLDDVRIYDHALSEREVRDLSLGVLSQYRLSGDLIDTVGTGSISIGTGTFVSSDIGTVADVTGTTAFIPLSAAPLQLKGEAISFKLRCNKPRANVPGGRFNHHFIQWGSYYTSNSGGFGIIEGVCYGNLRGPGASGWTNNFHLGGLNNLYDQHDWITFVIIFTESDRIQVYANGQIYLDAALSVPFTGLDSYGIHFGANLQAQVCDIRIHTTALTAEQVKELYQQRASLDSRGNIHTKQLEETPFNAVPSFKDWNLGTGIQLLKDNEILFPVNGSITSPWFDVTGLSGGYFSAEFYSDEVSRKLDHQPDAGAHVTTAYTDSLGNPVPNTYGHSGNGYAFKYPTGTWFKMRWYHVLGNGITRCRLLISNNSTWTSASFKVRNVMWTPFHPGDALPDGYHSGGYKSPTTPKPGVTATGLTTPNFSEVGPANGLVAWYPLIGDTKDYAGTNHAVNNGAVATAEGYEFDGGDTLTAPTVLDRASPQLWTVSAWVYIDSNSTGVAQYLNNYNRGNILVRSPYSTLSLLYLNAGANDSYIYGPTLPVGSWAHVVFRHDQSIQDVRMFVNMVQYGPSTNYGPTDIPYGLPITTTFGQGLTGKLRDIRIYNRALSTEEIGILYKMTSPTGSKATMTQDCIYTPGQFKEVIS